MKGSFQETGDSPQRRRTLKGEKPQKGQGNQGVGVYTLKMRKAKRVVSTFIG